MKTIAENFFGVDESINFIFKRERYNKTKSKRISVVTDLVIQIVKLDVIFYKALL